MEQRTIFAAVGLDILLASRAQLCMALPYLSGPLCALAPQPGTASPSAPPPTASAYYNAAYLATLYSRASAVVNRLYLHSVLHCMFRHLAKRRGRDAALWDLACDAAVESVIDALNYACLAGRTRPSAQKFYVRVPAGDEGADR